MNLAPSPPSVARASRRLTRTGLFLAETLLDVGRRPLPGAPARARRLRWVAENLCATHGLEVHVRGRVPDEPSALVANHLGYLDPVAILAQLPALPIAKAEVARWPLLGGIGQELGVLFVRRECGLSGARVLRAALGALTEGVSVLAFPEGTTSSGDRLLDFRRGLFGVAALAQAPIVPVAVRYVEGMRPWIGNDPFVPHYLRTAAAMRGRLELTFLDPLAPRGAPDVLAERARHLIASTLFD